MKIKQSPDDFYVEELTDVQPTEVGNFTFYRLEKRGWTTPDALAAIRRRWDQIEFRRISYGGLKDRHAHTIQYFSILHGPQRHLSQNGLEVRYLGRLSQPYGSPDVRANRFHVTLRDLSESAAQKAILALGEVARFGYPNYFDDQRFGSVPRGAERPPFVAREMVLGRFEEALKLALTAEYEYDSAIERREKGLLIQHWGDWAKLKAELPRGHARSLVDYLRLHPGKFRATVERLRPDLRGLYLSAYQSYLWNRMLALWIRQELPASQYRDIMLKLGAVPFQTYLNEDQRRQFAQTALPLPSARLKSAGSEWWLGIVRTALAEEGFELEQMKIKGIREPFFSRGERPVLCLPAGIGHDLGPDDRHPGRLRLTVSFDLPRGSYATLLIKRISE